MAIIALFGVRIVKIIKIQCKVHRSKLKIWLLIIYKATNQVAFHFRKCFSQKIAFLFCISCRTLSLRRHDCNLVQNWLFSQQAFNPAGRHCRGDHRLLGTLLCSHGHIQVLLAIFEAHWHRQAGTHLFLCDLHFNSVG